MPKYEPIPTPPAQKWREFRMRFLPLMTFAAAFVATVLLWNRTIGAPTLIGEVEPHQAWVTSREVGIVTNLLVQRFDRVTNGQPVAIIIGTDPRTMSSQIQDLRSRIAMSQLELNAVADRERIAFDYQALNMSTLRFRADLAAARAALPSLEAALERNRKGMEEQVISINDYELSLRERDAIKAQADELERLVADSEARLRQAAGTAEAFTNSMSGVSLAETIERINTDRAEVEGVRSQPTILVSPMDGVVSSIVRRAGENVVAGDIVMTIHSIQGERIVGYLRQPLPFPVTEGMPVRVRCRTNQREEAMSQIEQIAPRYEPITNLSLLRPGFLYEIGMPISIPVPPELRPTLVPGELVDLSIER